MSLFDKHREHLAGLLVGGIGAFAVLEGQSYGIGTLTAMGSGFFPVALGAGMIALGILMAAVPAAPAAHLPGHGPSRLDWRGGLSIAAAVVLFILLANRAGLAPAIFACVFTAALGTRQTTLREAALLALGVTVFGVLLFAYGLKVPFPIIAGVYA